MTRTVAVPVLNRAAVVYAVGTLGALANCVVVRLAGAAARLVAAWIVHAGVGGAAPRP